MAKRSKATLRKYQLQAKYSTRKQGSRSLDRVGVVGAGPGWRATSLLHGVDNANNRTVRSTNHQKGTRDNDEDAVGNHQVPSKGSLTATTPVVIEPHATHGLEGHQGSEKSADERHETSEDGNATGDEVGDDSGSGGAADPGDPVGERVGSEMLRAAEHANESVLGGVLDAC